MKKAAIALLLLGLAASLFVAQAYSVAGDYEEYDETSALDKFGGTDVAQFDELLDIAESVEDYELPARSLKKKKKGKKSKKGKKGKKSKKGKRKQKEPKPEEPVEDPSAAGGEAGPPAVDAPEGAELEEYSSFDENLYDEEHDMPVRSLIKKGKKKSKKGKGKKSKKGRKGKKGKKPKPAPEPEAAPEEGLGEPAPPAVEDPEAAALEEYDAYFTGDDLDEDYDVAMRSLKKSKKGKGKKGKGKKGKKVRKGKKKGKKPKPAPEPEAAPEEGLGEPAPPAVEDPEAASLEEYDVKRLKKMKKSKIGKKIRIGGYANQPARESVWYPLVDDDTPEADYDYFYEEY